MTADKGSTDQGKVADTGGGKDTNPADAGPSHTKFFEDHAGNYQGRTLMVGNPGTKGAEYFDKNVDYKFTIGKTGKVDIQGTKKGTLSFAWDGKDKDAILVITSSTTATMYEPDGTNAQKMISIATSTTLKGVFQINGGFYDTSGSIPKVTGIWNLTGVKKLP